MSGSKKGTRFILDFGSVELPLETVERLDEQIRNLGLSTLAEVASDTDRRGGYLVAIPFPPNIPPGTTRGAVYEPPDGADAPVWPPEWLGTEADDAGIVAFTSLTASDHTRVVSAIMDNVFAVLRHLPPGVMTPTGTQVLKAALETNAIDAGTKSRISAMLAVLPLLEEARRDASPELIANIEAAINETSGLAAAERAKELRTRATSENNEEISAALECAAAILDDGADTVYNPANAFYQLLGEGRSDDSPRWLSTAADADAVGAAIGGGIGLLAAGVGAGPGAAAGGGGASVGAIVGEAILWLAR